MSVSMAEDLAGLAPALLVLAPVCSPAKGRLKQAEAASELARAGDPVADRAVAGLRGWGWAKQPISHTMSHTVWAVVGRSILEKAIEWRLVLACLVSSAPGASAPASSTQSIPQAPSRPSALRGLKEH